MKVSVGMSQEPAVLRYVWEALVKEPPQEGGLALTEAELGHLLVVLKTVVDALHEASRF